MSKDYLNRIIILCVAAVIVIALMMFTVFRYVYSVSIIEFEAKQEDKSLSQQIVLNQILSAIESTNLRLDTLVELTVKSTQANKDSMEQLIVMNTAFLSWAETQGLIVRE